MRSKKLIVFSLLLLTLVLLLASCNVGDTGNGEKTAADETTEAPHPNGGGIIPTPEAPEHVCEDEMTYRAEAKCGVEGLEVYSCKSCGRVREVKLEALEHSFTKYISNNDATCTADGTETAICDLCRKQSSTRPVEGSKLEHTYGKWREGEGNTRVATCKCGDKKSDSYEPHDHRLVLNGPDPLTNAYDFVCSVCSSYYDVADVLTYTVEEGELDGSYRLSVSASRPVYEFKSNVFAVIHPKLNVSCEGYTRTVADLHEDPALLELVFGENIKEIHVANSFGTVKTVTFSGDVSKICSDSLIGCFALEEAYFLGDCPDLESGALFTAYSKDGSSIAPTAYYNEGAKGFSGYKLQGFTLCKVGQPTPELPQMTVSEYAKGASAQAILLCAELYGLCLDSEYIELMYMPYCALDSYKQIKDLALSLTSGLESDKEKAEAIFDWIVENIAYDTEALTYPCEKVFETRRAVCNGYVLLMHDMLAAVDIMSFYVHGIGLEGNEVTVERLLGDAYGSYDPESNHSWIYCVLDGEVTVCDPTWGEFDISADELAKTRVPLNMGGIGICPEGVDPRAYAEINYYENGRLYHLTKGQLSRINGFEINYNLTLSVDYHTHTLHDKMSFGGNAPEIYDMYRDVKCERDENGTKTVYVFLPDFNRRTYAEVLEYLEFESANYPE